MLSTEYNGNTKIAAIGVYNLINIYNYITHDIIVLLGMSDDLQYDRLQTTKIV